MRQYSTCSFRSRRILSLPAPRTPHAGCNIIGADYNPLEEEFISKLKAIEGTSLHETQEITFEAL